MMRNNASTNHKLGGQSAALSPPSPSESSNPLIEPRQLDANLYELSLISQRSALFNSFMNERATDEMEALASDESEKELVMKGKDSKFYGENGLLLSSGLTKRVRELMSSYLVIDEYLLKKSVDKAMKLDDYDSQQTSSCVDDVFFILKAVLKRCISTYEPEVIGSTVRTMTKVLEGDYLNIFQQKLSTVFTMTGYDGAGRNGDKAMETAKVSYMVILNNLDVSADYIIRLTEEMEPSITKGLWLDEENDVKQSLMYMEEFKGFSDKFKTMLQVSNAFYEYMCVL